MNRRQQQRSTDHEDDEDNADAYREAWPHGGRRSDRAQDDDGTNEAHGSSECWNDNTVHWHNAAAARIMPQGIEQGGQKANSVG